jgi:hypothetical protein
VKKKTIPKPGAGGATTDTTSSQAGGSGGMATEGPLTGATTTAPVPTDEADDMAGFFSTGTGPALHYHPAAQTAESDDVQDTGGSQ